MAALLERTPAADPVASPHDAPELLVIDAENVDRVLAGRASDVIDVVRDAYLTHDANESTNPDSCFLRFPDKPRARIIALPAYLGGRTDVAGIKWIASFPENIDHDLQRASAVLILNDYTTGYPFAFLEASRISAARTAASAALAARTLCPAPASLGIVGAGVIARTIADYLGAIGYCPTDARCYDVKPTSADALVHHIGGSARPTSCARALTADLVVFATTSGSPYIPAEHRFAPGQTVLNISLRDLDPATLAEAHNILDDVDHCLKADTSPHLLEKRLGHRGFVTGTLGDVLRGRVHLDRSRPVIFSPFGLGVLDLAVGSLVYQETLRSGHGHLMSSFYGDARRW